MRLLVLALAIDAVSACGGSTLEKTTEGDAGVATDTGAATEGGATTCTGPKPACSGCCGEPAAAECGGGGWVCPVFGCPGLCAPIDAGQSACTSEAPPCAGCCGESIAAECSDGGWSCPWLGCPVGICGDVDAGE